ncbi:MAG: molybdate-binding protein [Acidimicrobiaceae bacterium]|nr:molybdate-binding protein [Acidimicrobiaceae bacterium]HAB56586.1 molybdate-binding protein [Acidimicrobiaceae bacterium]
MDQRCYRTGHVSGRIVALIGAIAAIVVVLTVLGARGDADTPLVFAPSSLAPFEAELDAALIESGIGPVEWVFAGSQSLVTQLIDGAPADVLITADAATFARANAAGVTWDDGHNLVTNGLVLAVAPGNPGGISSLDDLGRSDLLVGVCAPEVPCGRLAMAATNGRVAIDADTEETNVRALTTKLLAGELDVGLVYRTDARAAGLETIADDTLGQTTTDYQGSANPAGAAVLASFDDGAAQAVLLEAGFLGVTT